MVQRGGDWAGPQPVQAPLRCTKCNIPPINGQCTNHRMSVVVRFLPCDAMHKRGYCRHAVSVCLSVRLFVCPSVTFVSCAKTNKDIFEFFSPSLSHTILVFCTKRGGDIPTGSPPNGGVECRWGIGRNRDSGLIAGYRKLLDVRSAKNIYRRRS